ncbi:hypothetical protein AB0C69_01685 [Actinomadura sp. NPDC048032]|uniref:hypothetical protein n=1 Tax=Actinomadura sp. NPDC048032 TaxID=3155747 RepID=UPI00340C2340
MNSFVEFNNGLDEVQNTFDRLAAELDGLGAEVDPFDRIKLQFELNKARLDVLKTRQETTKTEVGVLTTDFNQMKSEQHKRIGYRDTLIYTAFAVVAGAAYAITQGASLLVLLGLIPAVLSLGWIYLANDTKVGEIGQFIRSELAPRMKLLLPAGATPFGWESWHRGLPGRLTGKIGHLAVTLTIFCVFPVTAFTIVIGNLSTLPSWVFPVGGVEAIATLCIGWLFLRANLGRRTPQTVAANTGEGALASD